MLVGPLLGAARKIFALASPQLHVERSFITKLVSGSHRWRVCHASPCLGAACDTLGDSAQVQAYLSQQAGDENDDESEDRPRWMAILADLGVVSGQLGGSGLIPHLTPGP